MRSTSRLRFVIVAFLMAIPFLGGATASASAPVNAPHPKDCCHVTIPSNYVYDTSRGSLHDYCTSSPDEFSAPGTNANFRGACARHDMCYQYKQQSRSGCDNSLLTNLDHECTYTYTSWYDVRRGACRDTAVIYWAAVKIHTFWS